MGEVQEEAEGFLGPQGAKTMMWWIRQFLSTGEMAIALVPELTQTELLERKGVPTQYLQPLSEDAHITTDTHIQLLLKDGNNNEIKNEDGNGNGNKNKNEIKMKMEMRIRIKMSMGIKMG